MLSVLGDDLEHDRCGLEMFPAVAARCWLGLAHVSLGAFDRGLAFVEDARRRAESIGRSYTLAIAYWALGHACSTAA